jgi:hypothetical protein
MIKVFKMINGEELISESEPAGVGYTLENPASIVMQQTEKGMGVAIAPYMPYAQGRVTLYATAIAAEAEPDDKMKNEYNRIFGSGIQVVPASALPRSPIIT